MTLTSTGPMCSPGVLLPLLFGVDDGSAGNVSPDDLLPVSTSLVNSCALSSSLLAINTSPPSEVPPALDAERDELFDLPTDS